MDEWIQGSWYSRKKETNERSHRSPARSADACTPSPFGSSATTTAPTMPLSRPSSPSGATCPVSVNPPLRGVGVSDPGQRLLPRGKRSRRDREISPEEMGLVTSDDAHRDRRPRSTRTRVPSPSRRAASGARSSALPRVGPCPDCRGSRRTAGHREVPRSCGSRLALRAALEADARPVQGVQLA